MLRLYLSFLYKKKYIIPRQMSVIAKELSFARSAMTKGKTSY